MNRRLVTIGVGVTLAGAALAWRGWRHSREFDQAAPPPPAAATVTVIDDRHPVPAFRLRRPGGEVTRADLEGRWTMLFFGYTQCPDVCPTALSLMAEVKRRLPAGRRPQVMFISVDSARDTLELLGNYVPAFDAEFFGAVGDDAAIAPLVQHFGVMFQRNPPNPQGSYTVDHTASMFLVDPRARLKAVFSPPHDLEAMVADLARLMR